MGDVLAVDAQDDVAEAVHLQEVAQLGVEEEASNGEMGVILQCDRATVNNERTRAGWCGLELASRDGGYLEPSDGLGIADLHHVLQGDIVGESLEHRLLVHYTKRARETKNVSTLCAVLRALG